MNDKQRAEFEKWWLENCDGYGLGHKLVAGLAYKAAIASVVVTMPEPILGDKITWLVKFQDVKDAIEKAGVSYE